MVREVEMVVMLDEEALEVVAENVLVVWGLLGGRECPLEVDLSVTTDGVPEDSRLLGC